MSWKVNAILGKVGVAGQNLSFIKKNPSGLQAQVSIRQSNCLPDHKKYQLHQICNSMLTGTLTIQY